MFEMTSQIYYFHMGVINHAQIGQIGPFVQKIRFVNCFFGNNEKRSSYFSYFFNVS